MRGMIFIWLVAVSVVCAAKPADMPHPRLWFPTSAEAPLRDRLAADPLAAKLHRLALAEAEKALKAPVCRYDIPDGRRLLTQSRNALHHIMHCAWAWRLTGDERFLRRAIAEMDAASSLKDWNPSHFLDVAEMATAVATGYDWLHASLTPAQRNTYETALITKALLPAKKVYESNGWWAQPKNNWSQVCGGGIAIAAAAMAEIEPELSDFLFRRGLGLIKQCGAFYAPDGMYPEGPGYWHYGTNYHAMFLAASEVMAIPPGDDPVMEKAGDAMMHLTSPSRLGFNFADGNARREVPSPAQCWLAAHYGNEAQARHVRSLFERAFNEDDGGIRTDRYFPLAILWLPGIPGPGEQPKAATFRGEQAIATFRTGWSARDCYLAIKGGTPAASHGHMDVGSFVYDAHGHRWIDDLGSEDYNLPGYFGGDRWSYFRLQNRAHNTLEIAGKLQNSRSRPCPLISSTFAGDHPEATFDLSDAYAGAAAKVVRRATFDARSGVTMLEDTIEKPRGVVLWRALTKAKAEVRGNEVLLRMKGAGITLRDAKRVGRWRIESAKPPTPEENQNPGVSVLVLEVPQAETVGIQIEIRP